MSIASILQGREQSIISGQPSDTVQMAVDILAQHRIGAIPIVDHGKVIGIFSERDFVRLMSSYGAEVLTRPLREVMTQSPVSAEPELPILAALSLMTQKRIRHLPVVSADALIGFISIGDLVKHRIDKIESEAAAMRDYIAS